MKHFALISILLTSAIHLSAQISTGSGAYELTNRSSGLALVNNGYVTSNGYAIAQEPSDHGADARWEITAVSGGYYTITNQASGLVLCDIGWQMGNGYTIGQWSNDGGADALWQFVPLGGGYYQIVNQLSGLTLVDAGYNPNPGYSIAQWIYDGGSAGQWLLTEVSGGSDYVIYSLPTCDSSYLYGVIYNYDTQHTAYIDPQLQQMYNNGQRSIKLGVQFTHGTMSGGWAETGNGSTVLTDGGAVPGEYQSNLASLLAKIKQLGFTYVGIEFLPTGGNAPLTWGSFSPTAPGSLAEENWVFISNLHQTIVDAGINYYIDIDPEGIPSTYATPTQQSVLLQYAQWLWGTYMYAYNYNAPHYNDATISMITQQPDGAPNPGGPDTSIFNNVASVFAQNPYQYPGGIPLPTVYDLHIYASSQEVPGTNAAPIVQAANSTLGSTIPWIIGEVFYNDPSEPAQLISGIQSTHQPISRIFQWQWSSARSCNPNNGGFDTPTPALFNYWASYAF